MSNSVSKSGRFWSKVVFACTWLTGKKKHLYLVLWGNGHNLYQSRLLKNRSDSETSDFMTFGSLKNSRICIFPPMRTNIGIKSEPPKTISMYFIFSLQWINFQECDSLFLMNTLQWKNSFIPLPHMRKTLHVSQTVNWQMYKDLGEIKTAKLLDAI